ncbi:receptor-type tyrosine-protein phosphatase S isoform X6 [Tachysurus ichikawai]
MLVPHEDLLPPGFPNIDMGPQLKVVERTRTANMLCAASGNPDPEITWFKDFLPIDPSTSNGRIKQLRSGKTVTFHFLAGFLKHTYICTKTFVAGFKFNSLCNLCKADTQRLLMN